MTTIASTDAIIRDVEKSKSDIQNIKDNLDMFATKDALEAQKSLNKLEVVETEKRIYTDLLGKINEISKNFYSTKFDKLKFYALLLIAATGLAAGSYWSLRTDMRNDMKDLRAEFKEMRSDINSNINSNTKQLSEFQAEIRLAIAELKKTQGQK